MGKVKHAKQSRLVTKQVAVVNGKVAKTNKRGFKVFDMHSGRASSTESFASSSSGFARESYSSTQNSSDVSDEENLQLSKRIKRTSSSSPRSLCQSALSIKKLRDEENDDTMDDTFTESKTLSEMSFSTIVKGLNEFKMYIHQDNIFIVLSEFSAVLFGGTCLMAVLQGNIEVYGSKVSASEKLILPIESIPGSCVQITNRGYKSQVDNIRQVLDQIGAGNAFAKAQELLSRFPRKTIIIAHQRKNSFTTLKPNFHSADDSTQENTWGSLKQYFIRLNTDDGIHNNRRFDELANSLYKAAAETSVRAVIVGPKDSGKSSTIRALCNKFVLQRRRNAHHESEHSAVPVLVLDLDPGQTEFTPPGCVSLVQVTEILMGPPSGHQTKPELSFLVGGTTPGANPDIYVAAINALMRHVQEYSCNNYIMLVNTMGWLTGIGELLLGNIIDIVNPTQLLTTSFQFKQPAYAWPFKELTSEEAISTSQVPRLEGMFTKDPYTKSVKSTLHREAAIIGYFGGSTIMEKHPVAIPWNRVALHDMSGLTELQEILYLINGNMVALCRVRENILMKSKSDSSLFKLISKDAIDEPFECLGFGIVRSIDSSQRILHVVSPESDEVLSSVNALIHNGVSLPECFFKEFQRFSSGPYLVNSDEINE